MDYNYYMSPEVEELDDDDVELDEDIDDEESDDDIESEDDSDED